MNCTRTRAWSTVCALALWSGFAPAQVAVLGEDFSGDWGMFYSPIDTAAAAEDPHTPTLDANNRSLGTWGGYYPVAGASQGGLFLGDDALPNFIPEEGSLFGIANPAAVGNGFLFFGAYPAEGGGGADETGGYAYVAFPSRPINLTGAGRVQFDACNGTTQPSNTLNLRILLRLTSAAPQWIISQSVPITGAIEADINNPPASGSIFSNSAIIDVAPSSLTWNLVSAPTDSALVPITPGGEQPLTIGASVPSPNLTHVTGFGLLIATDIQRGDAYGIGIDAIRLLGNVTSVTEFTLYY